MIPYYDIKTKTEMKFDIKTEIRPKKLIKTKTEMKFWYKNNTASNIWGDIFSNFRVYNLLNQGISGFENIWGRGSYDVP